MDRAKNSLLLSQNDSEASRYSVLLEKRYDQEFRRANGRFWRGELVLPDRVLPEGGALDGLSYYFQSLGQGQ